MGWEDEFMKEEKAKLREYSKLHEHHLEEEHLRNKLREEYFQCIFTDSSNRFEEALKKIANLIIEAYYLGYIDGQDNKPLDLILGNVYARKIYQK